MGLNEVKAAIKDKTEAEVGSLLELGKSEGQKSIAEAQEQIRQKKAYHSAKTEELLAALERKELAAANFVRKSILLDQKRKAIEDVCDGVRQRLSSMSASERQALLTDFAANAAKQLNVQRVECNTIDVQALSKLFPEATIIAADISGGFIAENGERSMSLDQTYETILTTIKEENLAELNQLLFI